MTPPTKLFQWPEQQNHNRLISIFIDFGWSPGFNWGLRNEKFLERKNFSSGLNCQVEMLHSTSARFAVELPRKVWTPSSLKTRNKRSSRICRWGVRCVRALCCGSTHSNRKLTTPKVWIKFRLFKTLQTAGRGSEVRTPHSQHRLAREHKRAPTESEKICGRVGSCTSVFELWSS